MVELMKPTPEDIIVDPACGTAGFLVAAGEYLRENKGDLFLSENLNEHFNNTMFYGFDMDRTMLRIGAMNLMQHGIEILILHIKIHYQRIMKIMGNIH